MKALSLCSVETVCETITVKWSISSVCGSFHSCCLPPAEKHFKFPSSYFFFSFRENYLSPDRCRDVFPKAARSVLIAPSSVLPFLHCQKVETVMLTVASLQSPFNGASTPASPEGRWLEGRWGDWLWLLAIEDQPAAAHIHYADIYASSLK